MASQYELMLAQYKSGAQRARVFSESWVEANLNCPKCNHRLSRTRNNTMARDFTCESCRAGFELKSKKGLFGAIVPDGAYDSMVSSIRSDQRPHLLLLNYTQDYRVQSVAAVPRQFLVEEIVIPRRPLGAHCRRAGWRGCNLNIGMLPPDGRVCCVTDFKAEPTERVRAAWTRSEFLDEYRSSQRGWITLTMSLVRRIGTETFSLRDVYALESEAQLAFPDNLHVREKLRQQLQVLRDKGWLEFLSRGTYRLTHGVPPQ